MKKWFEYQLENVTDRSRWAESYTPVTNLHAHLADDFDNVKRWFLRALAAADPAIDRGQRVMAYESYISMIENCYTDDTVRKNVRTWFTDPEFALLCNQPSYDFVELNKHMPDFSSRLCQAMQVHYSDSRVFLQVQQPGYISPLHIDARRHLAGTEQKTEDGRGFANRQNADYDRWFIFLEDWIMGQVLQMGTEFIKWRAGDVYYWNVRDVPHALTNIGYEPRYLILLKARKIRCKDRNLPTVDQ
jgi:hypothetical protein